MATWGVNTENSISVITNKILDLTASYILENDPSGVYTPLLGVFNKYDNRYVIKHTFSQIGKYIVKIHDNNNNFIDLYNKVSVIDETANLQVSLDAYSNKNAWKGLDTAQEIKITDTNLVVNTLSTVLNNVKSTVDTLPGLTDIENSSVLAKKSDISVVETICNSLPALADIRSEMINVTFGGLEIANNQLTIKDQSGVIIAIFDLFDKNGNATMLSVYRRVVV